MSNEFLDVLEHQKAPPTQQPEVIATLESFCEGVQQFKQGKLACGLVSGNTTNWGQEWKPTIRSLSKGYEHVLFRAYVPMSGLPVRLDFYPEVLEFHAIDALKEGLKQFLLRPNIRETIEVFSR